MTEGDSVAGDPWPMAHGPWPVRSLYGHPRHPLVIPAVFSGNPHCPLSFPPFSDRRTSGTGLRGNPGGFFKDGPRERKAAELTAGPTASFSALDWPGRAGFFLDSRFRGNDRGGGGHDRRGRAQ